jgi:ABC-type bacteriocin/lantibiotic exporter with double-glycine peptidase domain
MFRSLVLVLLSVTLGTCIPAVEAFAITPNSHDALTTKRDKDLMQNQICGLHAVRRVLAAHGISVEITDLLDAADWSVLDHGTNLKTLKTLLNDHGISVTAIRLQPGWRGQLKEPAILFVPASVKSTGRLGHFVTVEPTEEAQGCWRVWEDSGGPTLVPRIDAVAIPGAVLLLASKTPADLKEVSEAPVFDTRTFCLILSGGAVLISVVVMVQSRRAPKISVATPHSNSTGKASAR